MQILKFLSFINFENSSFFLGWTLHSLKEIGAYFSKSKFESLDLDVFSISQIPHLIPSYGDLVSFLSSG